MKKIIRFFDKLEDKVRGRLSHWPIIYGFVTGLGIVMFWRGAWHTMDMIMENITSSGTNATTDLSGLPWWDGPLSLLLGTGILLLIGAFISNFIGNEIIISGLRGEKKLTEKTESEVRTEVGAIGEIKQDIKTISIRLQQIELKAKK